MKILFMSFTTCVNLLKIEESISLIKIDFFAKIEPLHFDRGLYCMKTLNFI